MNCSKIKFVKLLLYQHMQQDFVKSFKNIYVLIQYHISGGSLKIPLCPD